MLKFFFKYKKNIKFTPKISGMRFSEHRTYLLWVSVIRRCWRFLNLNLLINFKMYRQWLKKDSFKYYRQFTNSDRVWTTTYYSVLESLFTLICMYVCNSTALVTYLKSMRIFELALHSSPHLIAFCLWNVSSIYAPINMCACVCVCGCLSGIRNF